VKNKAALRWSKEEKKSLPGHSKKKGKAGAIWGKKAAAGESNS